jgi:hypothetical protein
LRRTISPLLLATVLVAGFSSIQSTKGELAQKPVKEATTYPSFIGPAATLNETFLSTDLVLRGRVLGSSPRTSHTLRDVAHGFAPAIG